MPPHEAPGRWRGWEHHAMCPCQNRRQTETSLWRSWQSTASAVAAARWFLHASLQKRLWRHSHPISCRPPASVLDSAKADALKPFPQPLPVTYSISSDPTLLVRLLSLPWSSHRIPRQLLPLPLLGLRQVHLLPFAAFRNTLIGLSKKVWSSRLSSSTGLTVLLRSFVDDSNNMDLIWTKREAELCSPTARNPSSGHCERSWGKKQKTLESKIEIRRVSKLKLRYRSTVRRNWRTRIWIDIRRNTTKKKNRHKQAVYYGSKMKQNNLSLVSFHPTHPKLQMLRRHKERTSDPEWKRGKKTKAWQQQSTSQCMTQDRENKNKKHRKRKRQRTNRRSIHSISNISSNRINVDKDVLDRWRCRGGLGGGDMLQQISPFGGGCWST